MKENFIKVWGGFWSIFDDNKLFFPQETGRIAEKLYAVKDRDVNLFVYTAGDKALCVDAGYIHNDYLREEFARIGIDPASITHLFITHTDMDHAGSVDKDSRVDLFPNAEMYMSRDEVQMIDGSVSRRFIFRSPVEITRKCQLLDDGDLITVGGAVVKAISTPGHTLGHMSFLINDAILCSADSLVLTEGKVEPFYRTWNKDQELTEQSLRKQAVLRGVEWLCTAHTRCTQDFDALMERWRE